MDIEVNDIIQITDYYHDWYPTLLVVSEVRNWGVVSFAFHLDGTKDGVKVQQAPIRLSTNQFVKVGRAVIVPDDTHYLC